MRRLMVLCICGERIQVPRSALGKTGLCPACGRSIAISADSATPIKQQPYARPAPQPGAHPGYGAWGRGNGSSPSPEAKQRFAEAVDLYFAQRFAQALSIFEWLAEEYPGNSDIDTGRAMCMTALQRRPQLGLEHKPGGTRSLPAPAESGLADRESERPGGKRGDGIPQTLDEETLKRVLLDKMLNGSDDDIQLRAAELAVKVFGFGEKRRTDQDRAPDLDEVLEGVEADDPSADPNSSAPRPQQS